eukprot:2266677-Rhodomonas_salina.15
MVLVFLFDVRYAPSVWCELSRGHVRTGAPRAHSFVLTDRMVVPGAPRAHPFVAMDFAAAGVLLVCYAPTPRVVLREAKVLRDVPYCYRLCCYAE